MSVSNESLDRAVREVLAFKCRTWDEDEFNCVYLVRKERLIKEGATQKQLEEFDAKISEAPTIDGEFNMYNDD